MNIMMKSPNRVLNSSKFVPGRHWIRWASVHEIMQTCIAPITNITKIINAITWFKQTKQQISHWNNEHSRILFLKFIGVIYSNFRSIEFPMTCYVLNFHWWNSAENSDKISTSVNSVEQLTSNFQYYHNVLSTNCR